MRRTLQTIIAAGMLGTLVTLAAAQSSTSTVTYQGVLTQNGTPVPDGTQTLVFKIYDAASGGNVVETISVPGVQTTQGRFAAGVPVANAAFNGQDRWWSVTFNGTELARQKVTAAPYAINSAAATGLRYGDSPTSQVIPVQGNLETTGQLALNRSIDPLALISARVGNGVTGSAVGRFVHDFDSASVWLNYRETSNPNLVQMLRCDTAAGYVFVVRNDGRVGIGLQEPQAALHVNGEARCSVLTITGADLAEKFDIAPAQKAAENGKKPIPGMVVSIDPKNPGKLMIASAAYDKKVAGIISGANGLDAGVILGKGNPNPLIDGEHPVAMTGRVWVYVDESVPGSRIEPGDRLTTSSTKPGYAMKVLDESKAPGAVIGKAMTPRDEKTGMVLVLVNLQ